MTFWGTLQIQIPTLETNKPKIYSKSIFQSQVLPLSHSFIHTNIFWSSQKAVLAMFECPVHLFCNLVCLLPSFIAIA